MRLSFLHPIVFFIAVTVFAETTEPASVVKLQKTETGYDVLLDDALFAGYRTDFQGAPILWPIIGPGGQRMTREFPMNPEPPRCELKDHPHHRSIWFTHGEVADAGGSKHDFWAIGEKKGKIRHKAFLEAACDGKAATLRTENDWVTVDGKTLCTDFRTITFARHGAMRQIDFDITIKARQEITFGDTKEGTFGVRVPGSVDVDAKKRSPEWGGTILNSNGERDDATWAKRASWCDYSGPVDDAEHGRKIVGIAVLNHPDSFQYPTYWHVRTYGLFAANPFGIHDFQDTKITDKKAAKPGDLKLRPDETVRFRYRILLHDGPADPELLDQAFKAYRLE